MRGFLEAFASLFLLPQSPSLFQSPALPPSSSHCVSCHLKASDYLLLSAVKSGPFRLQRRYRPHRPQLFVSFCYHLGGPGPNLEKFLPQS